MARHPAPWRVDRNNDTGPDDKGYWEWWEVRDAHGDTIAECAAERDAELLVALGNAAAETATPPTTHFGGAPL